MPVQHSMVFGPGFSTVLLRDRMANTSRLIVLSGWWLAWGVILIAGLLAITPR